MPNPSARPVTALQAPKHGRVCCKNHPSTVSQRERQAPPQARMASQKMSQFDFAHPLLGASPTPPGRRPQLQLAGSCACVTLSSSGPATIRPALSTNCTLKREPLLPNSSVPGAVEDTDSIAP